MNDNWRAVERAGRAAGLSGDAFGEYLNVALDAFNRAMERQEMTFESFDARYFSFLQEHVFTHDRVLDALEDANVDAEFVEYFSQGDVPVSILTGEASALADAREDADGDEGASQNTSRSGPNHHRRRAEPPAGEEYDVESVGCNAVFRLHSDFTLPLEDLREFLENARLPAGISDIAITRRRNALVCQAVAEEGVSKYTPVAQLKAGVVERRAAEHDQGVGTARNDDERVEHAHFEGDLESVLQNTVLQGPMFEVLVSLACYSGDGTLTAVVEVDGDLEAVRIVDGEVQPVSVRVSEEGDERTPSSKGIDATDTTYNT